MTDYIQDMPNLAPVVTDDTATDQNDDDPLPSTAKEMLDLLEADREYDASREHVEEQYLSAGEIESLIALRHNTANKILPDLRPPSPEIDYAKALTHFGRTNHRELGLDEPPPTIESPKSPAAESPKPVALSSLQAGSPSEKNDLVLLAKRKQNWPRMVFPVPVRPRDILAYTWSGGVGDLEGLGHSQMTVADARARSNPGGYYPSPSGNARPHTYPAGNWEYHTDNGRIVRPGGGSASSHGHNNHNHNHNHNHGHGPRHGYGYGYAQPSNGSGYSPRNENGVHYLPPRNPGGGGGRPPPNQLGGLGGRQVQGYYYYGNASDVSRHGGGTYYYGNGRTNDAGNAANGGPVYGRAIHPQATNAMGALNPYGNRHSYPGRSPSQSAAQSSNIAGHSYGNGGGPYPGERGVASAAPGQMDGFERFQNYLLGMQSEQPGTEEAVLKN